MEKNTLADIPLEGGDTTIESINDFDKEKEEKETPEGSQPKNKLEESTEKEPKTVDKPKKGEEEKGKEKDDKKKEEPTPFHKHPRFTKLVEERNQYKQDLQELKNNMDSKFSEIEKKDSQSKIPNWFSELYGDNENAWNEYSKYDKQNRADIKKEILDEMNSKQQEVDKQQQERDSYIDQEFQALEEEGKKFSRNEFMKFMIEWKPSNDKGQLDFQKGYKMFELMNKKDPKKMAARKKIASSKSSKAEPKSEKWKTPADLKGVGW